MSYYKYKKTPHVPGSPGATSDDKVLPNTRHLDGEEVVWTLKHDGENSSLYTDCFHARSLDSRHHPSRDWLAAFHASIAYNIPVGWRICGENMFAQHSIRYENLPSYFLGFSVWDDSNTALDWDETLEYFALLGVEPVTVLDRGPFSLARTNELVRSLDLEKDEGLVVRKVRRIHYSEFRKCYAKWVRRGHVQTDEHWMHGPIVANKLATTGRS
jgi:hypothetical protein